VPVATTKAAAPSTAFSMDLMMSLGLRLS